MVWSILRRSGTSRFTISPSANPSGQSRRNWSRMTGRTWVCVCFPRTANGLSLAVTMAWEKKFVFGMHKPENSFGNFATKARGNRCRGRRLASWTTAKRWSCATMTAPSLCSIEPRERKRSRFQPLRGKVGARTLLSPDGKHVVICTLQPPSVWDLERQESGRAGRSQGVGECRRLLAGRQETVYRLLRSLRDRTRMAFGQADPKDRTRSRSSHENGRFSRRETPGSRLRGRASAHLLRPGDGKTAAGADRQPPWPRSMESSVLRTVRSYPLGATDPSEPGTSNKANPSRNSRSIST